MAQNSPTNQDNPTKTPTFQKEGEGKFIPPIDISKVNPFTGERGDLAQESQDVVSMTFDSRGENSQSPRKK